MREEARVKDQYIIALEEEKRASNKRVGELERDIRVVKSECVEAMEAKELALA